MFIVTVAVVATSISSLLLMILVLRAHFYVTSFDDIIIHLHPADFDAVGFVAVWHSRIAVLHNALFVAQTLSVTRDERAAMFAQELMPCLRMMVWCGLKDLLKTFVPRSIVQYTDCAQKAYDEMADLMDNICRIEAPATLYELNRRL
jgi:hypothetical protein